MYINYVYVMNTRLGCCFVASFLLHAMQKRILYNLSNAICGRFDQLRLCCTISGCLFSMIVFSTFCGFGLKSVVKSSISNQPLQPLAIQVAMISFAMQ